MALDEINIPAHFKALTEYHLVGELPKTATGKIQKNAPSGMAGGDDAGLLGDGDWI